MADPKWIDIAAAGGIREWVDAEIARQGLTDPGAATISDGEKKAYKARREEERRVRKTLYKQAWAAYKQAHVVHLGAGVWWHDTADVDRFDADDPERKRQDNALAINDLEAFAKAVGHTIPKLRWLAYHRDVDSGTHYQRWTVPKRDGTPRLISAPKPDLKAVQRWIAREVTEHLPVHGAAHGFLVGRSIATNAAVHAGARVLVKLDIKDFYPTVTWRRVKGLLRRAGLGEQLATLLALLCTESPRQEVVTHGKTYYVATAPRSLPQGAPTSPSITNALCLRLDARLSGLAAKLGARYTRYADDLAFSWHDEASSPGAATERERGQEPRAGRGEPGRAKAEIGALMKAVGAIVRAEGFSVHPKKTRVMRSGARQQLTGMIVNKAPEGRPLARVPRTTVRNLRAAIKNRELGKPGKGETLEHLKGLCAFVMMTDRPRGAELMARVDKLIAARGGST